VGKDKILKCPKYYAAMLYFCSMYLPELLLLHWQVLLFILLCVDSFLFSFFYFLYFFSRLAFYKTKPKTNSQTHAVSVIVCAATRLPTWQIICQGILIQDYKSTHEVIVVNDNSFDESKYLLEELKKRIQTNAGGGTYAGS
jgi:cellulose synthase/poly-beta-1,6-N-acetylglucosamine synthase-like glycosyltransferase